MAAGWTIVYTGVGNVNAAFTEAINELATDEFDTMIRRRYSRI